jgi:hypothetical protein
MLGRERVSDTLSPAESQDRTRLDCEVRLCVVPHARQIVMELHLSELRGMLIPMTLAKFGKASEMKARHLLGSASSGAPQTADTLRVMPARTVTGHKQSFAEHRYTYSALP